MKKFILQVLKNIPLIVLCILLAFFIWVFATMTTDPTEEGRFTQTITIETVGLDEEYIITSGMPNSVSVNLRAPNSIWRRISMERVQGKAIIDVTNLEPGTHQIPINVQIGIAPVQVISVSPAVASITIEQYETREYPVTVEESGDIPTAFRADAPVLSQETVEISGTVAQLDRISKVSVSLEHNNNTESIEETLQVNAYTEEGRQIRDVTISPDKLKLTQEIRMRGGYRILSVKLSVKGEISQGYRVDNLEVDPGFVTVYSADKELLNSLNSFIETETVLLDEITSTTNRKVSLNIPDGITLVGDTTVNVNVEVSAVVGTQTFAQIPVSIIGVDDGLEAYISPADIDVYLAGPLISLAEIEPADIHAIVDLKDLGEGNYQLVPLVEVASNDPITVNSIQPQTIDVQITGIPVDDETGEAENTAASGGNSEAAAQ
ncbi:MAG: hypothetical protein IJI14_18260 [Anaerolineaceae bacterium]|nr:hypothetical protein [Anaerolineaceae bacterium]